MNCKVSQRPNLTGDISVIILCYRLISILTMNVCFVCDGHEIKWNHRTHVILLYPYPIFLLKIKVSFKLQPKTKEMYIKLLKVHYRIWWCQNYANFSTFFFLLRFLIRSFMGLACMQILSTLEKQILNVSRQLVHSPQKTFCDALSCQNVFVMYSPLIWRDRIINRWSALQIHH